MAQRIESLVGAWRALLHEVPHELHCPLARQILRKLGDTLDLID